MGLLNVQMSGLLFLVPSLELFYFCLFCPIPMYWFLFYLISFHYCLIEASFFSNERQKGKDPDEREGVEEPGRVEEGNPNQDLLCKKKTIFN